MSMALVSRLVRMYLDDCRMHLDDVRDTALKLANSGLLQLLEVAPEGFKSFSRPYIGVDFWVPGVRERCVAECTRGGGGSECGSYCRFFSRGSVEIDAIRGRVEGDVPVMKGDVRLVRKVLPSGCEITEIHPHEYLRHVHVRCDTLDKFVEFIRRLVEKLGR